MSSIGSPGGFFGSMAGGQTGSPASFMSSPINPQALAALAAMMNQGQQQPQGPQMAPPGMQPAQTPTGQPSPQALAGLNPQQQQPGLPQPGSPQGGANPQLLAALQKLSQLPPATAKAILARIGIGGQQQQQPPAMGAVQ